MPAPNPRTAPTLISGSRGVENLNTARVVVDMEDEILLYQASATPLLTLTGKIGQKRKATNVKYEYLEKDEMPRSVTASAVMTDVGLTGQFGAGEAARLVTGQLLLNLNSREVMKVNVVTSDTDVTFIRGIGGGNQPVAIGDSFVVMSNAKEDGAVSGTSKSIKEFNDFNYTQIIETPFDFTGRDLVTELYGGSDEMTETKWQAIEHKKSIELAMFFGRRYLATGVSHQITAMGGLEYFIVTNRANVAQQALNERWFIEYLEYAMRWGRGGKRNGVGKKYLLCSSRWLTEINLWVKDRLEYRVLDKEIGFAAWEYKSPHGIVYLVPTPILDDSHPDWAFLLDFNHLKYVYLNKRDTKLLVDVQENDRDGKKNLYRSDVGIQVNFEHAHGIITGITV
jgi:hypothetical protein